MAGNTKRQENKNAIQSGAQASTMPCTEDTSVAGFVLKTGKYGGLFKRKKKPGSDETIDIWIAPPIFVDSYIVGVSGGNAGLELRWKGRKKEYQFILPKRELAKRDAEWFSTLMDLEYDADVAEQAALRSYLCRVNPEKVKTCVTSTGWNEGNIYVTPSRIYSKESEGDIIFMPKRPVSPYSKAGEYDEWIKTIPELCKTSSRFSFALCIPFAAPLLKIMNIDGFIISFEGSSSCGKSTCLQAASSIIGGSECVKSWRVTSNALESIASNSNDTTLFLDELGMVSSKDLSEAVYMLSGGQGKIRADRSGNARQHFEWRTIVISSGELGISEKLSEMNIQARAGQETRFIGVPMDKEHITDLLGYSSAAQLVDKIKETCRTIHGHAMESYLSSLTKEFWENEPGVLSTLESYMQAAIARFCPKSAGSQVVRVAQKFALIEAAALYAIKLGTIQSNFDVKWAVEDCFKAWLDARGDTENLEEKAIIDMTLGFIEKHGASRFQDIYAQAGEKCTNRAGWYKSAKDDTVYYITTNIFKNEVIRGYSPIVAAKALHKAGILKREDNDNYTCRIQIKGIGRPRVYKIVLSKDENKEDNTENC